MNSIDITNVTPWYELAGIRIDFLSDEKRCLFGSWGFYQQKFILVIYKNTINENHELDCVKLISRISSLEGYKPTTVHFFTDFTSTANATVSTYGRDVPQKSTLLQSVSVVQDSHLLNIHPPSSAH
ncbi:hypothetical protein RF11_13210 [Thelohanellus kitauei]|uniref:Uncharacterized protein n=1 Tax=Thelohanellus kitauei TaxID=669202 RepID=A0A0C2NIC8_THEKT|nr:hypothetical protein RF11_13210 [Thelohanellus kitauei]